MTALKPDPVSENNVAECFFIAPADDASAGVVAEARSLRKELVIGGYAVYLRGLAKQLLWESDNDVCWVIGYHVRLPSASVHPEGGVDGDPVQSFIDSHTGRFLLLRAKDNEVRMYPDAIASLSMFVQKGTGRVTSSPAFFDSIANLRCTEGRAALSEVRRKTGIWYPMAITDFSDVDLLLPNHYLSLPDGVPTRFRYATEPPVFSRKERQDAFDAVLRHLVESVSALAEYTPFGIYITAGQDSRSLLAASLRAELPFRLLIEFTEGRTSELDLEVARRIAQSLDVPLHVNEVPSLVRSSFAGFGGEAGRGFYYHGGDIPRQLSVEFLVDRIGVRGCPEAGERMKRWLDSLDHWTPCGLLDLAYCELRVGTTFSPVCYSRSKVGLPVFCPFFSPAVIHAMLRLPYRDRLQGALGKNLTRRLHPKLSLIPFNQSLPTVSDLWRNRLLLFRDLPLGRLLRYVLEGLRGSVVQRKGVRASLRGLRLRTRFLFKHSP